MVGGRHMTLARSGNYKVRVSQVKGSDILNSAGFLEGIREIVVEPLWRRAECPGHGGAGILPAASILSGSFNFPAGQDV